MLRQEIYALDGTDAGDRPYSVTEQQLHDPSCCSREATNRHAVFFTHAREAIDFHYERKLYDVNGQQARRPARRRTPDAGGRRLRQRAAVRRDRLRPPA